jgi:sugar fermentation stimulation protein A
MKTFLQEGLGVYLLYDPSPQRKMDYRVMSMELPCGTLVGVDTSLTNGLVEEALDNKVMTPFKEATHWKREVVFTQGTRFDFQVFFQDQPSCFLEVKNVQMSRQKGIAEFPDAVTSRGAKHWKELIEAKKQGFRAALCFCIQRSDVTCLRLAHDIDPAYAQAAQEAVAAGVEVYAYICEVTPETITMINQVPVDFSL